MLSMETMTQLIAHLVGDYVLQNHHMATKKTKSWRWALLHATLYGVPFWLICGASPEALAVIVGTHAVIDRYRLAAYWVRFWGVGVNGWVMDQLAGYIEPVEPAPPWLGVWLLIIADNCLHMSINAASLAWL